MKRMTFTNVARAYTDQVGGWIERTSRGYDVYDEDDEYFGHYQSLNGIVQDYGLRPWA